MTDSSPDYSAFEPPDEKPPAEYTHHERRADILRLLVEAGSPAAVKQVQLADRYDVHESTISRDMDRLRESVAEHLGTDAKFTTRTLYQHVIEELLKADDWRATKAAWEIAMDWNGWLADIGEQHREPARSELDVHSRSVDVAYEVRRPGDEEPLPTTNEVAASGEDRIDYEAIGFTSAPEAIDVEAVDDAGGDPDE